MHEASLMKGFIKKVESIVEEQEGQRATALKVKIGCSSHMTPEHFREHFDEAAAGTVAEGAHLDVELFGVWSDPKSLEVILESVEVES